MWQDALTKRHAGTSCAENAPITIELAVGRDVQTSMWISFHAWNAKHFKRKKLGTVPLTLEFTSGA